MVPGQMGNIIASLFTDCWRTEVSVTPGNPPKYNFQVRTMPDYRFQLKNSLGLPPVFTFSWDLIAKKLAE